MEKLGRLPPGLEDSYDIIYWQLLDSDPHSQSLAKNAMSWLLCAKRLISTREFIAAVVTGYESNDTSLTPMESDEFPSREELLDVCCSLMIFDE